MIFRKWLQQQKAKIVQAFCFLIVYFALFYILLIAAECLKVRDFEYSQSPDEKIFPLFLFLFSREYKSILTE